MVQSRRHTHRQPTTRRIRPTAESAGSVKAPRVSMSLTHGLDTLSRMVESRESRDGSVQSVDRAISILQVLARGGSVRVSDIASNLDLHKSTVSRLLATLEARGLVAKNETRGSYSLSDGILQLAAGATRRRGGPVLDRQVCEELAEAVGETIVVTILDGDAVLSIDQVTGPAPISAINWIGQRSPLHATSSGKLFLAEESPESVARLLPTLARYTDRTIIDPQALATELAAVRDQGFAVVHGEREPGLSAVSVPVRDLEGRMLVALTVSGPSTRITAQAVPTLVAHARAAAARLSERNGHPKRG